MGLFGFSGGVFFLVVLSPAWGFSGARFASTSPNRCSRAFCGVGASERGGCCVVVGAGPPGGGGTRVPRVVG